jgi:hypothetical protein
MYRHGLGDCFLLTFPRKTGGPFHMLIDCGALARDRTFMTGVVEHVRDTVRDGKAGKATLDVVAATHEHKDHLSGFNQARDVFNADFDFGAVWLAWTENLGKPAIKRIKEARRLAADQLRAALATPAVQAAIAADANVATRLSGVEQLLGFSADDDSAGERKVSDALEYLKVRGRDARDLQFLEPGTTRMLDGVPGVRVYVLGPPTDPLLLKESEVTKQMKSSGIIYELAVAGASGSGTLGALVDTTDAPGTMRGDPFSEEHAITETSQRRGIHGGAAMPNPYFEGIRGFLADTYRKPGEEWRTIDHDWLRSVGQLALDLDNDTNNTSLVLAFEFTDTRDVLLFVGDAQVGNWRSWETLAFDVDGAKVNALDLLRRTVFYKVGHHGSHNATLKKNGLELMTHDDLVAFIPLDRQTAAAQGRQGWEMPAPRLFEALIEKAGDRVVVSDVNDAVPGAAAKAGVTSTETYIDYFYGAK